MFTVLGESLYHYTSAAKALAHIVPPRRLRLSPFSAMRDPRESSDWLISSTIDSPTTSPAKIASEMCFAS